MTIDLYMGAYGGGGRSVLLTASALGLKVNIKFIDTQKGEQLTPEFIKLNPQHTVPTLVDDGFSIWETRAICTYLVSRYGKNDSLYPKDVKQRAIVDQRLYFDLGVLTQRFYDAYLPVFFGAASVEKDKLDKLNEAVAHLNTFLDKTKYAAGDHLTVADLVLVNSISTLDAFKFDLSNFPNVVKWYKQIQKEAPGYEEGNTKYLKVLMNWVEEKKKEQKA